MSSDIKNIYFTKNEALEKVGKMVELLVNFAGLKKGTTGTVIKTDWYGGEKWGVVVQWHLREKPEEKKESNWDEPFIYVKNGDRLVNHYNKFYYENDLMEIGD